MNANKKLSAKEWQSLISDYLLSYNRQQSALTLVRKNGLKHIPEDIWKQWDNIISQNRVWLSQAADFNDLYERIEDLRIPGVGERCLIETASQFVYNDLDFSPDDSCWCFLVDKLSILKTLGTPTRSIKEYFSRLSQDFSRLSDMQKIDFILKYQSKIRQMIRNR